MSWNYSDDEVNGGKVFVAEEKCLQVHRHEGVWLTEGCASSPYHWNI